MSDEFPAELYDTEDVTIDIALPNRRKAVITVRSHDSELNFIKTYLALKDYVEEMESQLNIMEATEGDH